jgi:hypothetical protein
MDLLCVVQDYDPGTAKGLRQLLAMSAEELGYCGFDFANAGGSADVDVTVENREECVLSGEWLEHCSSPFLLCGCTPAPLSSPPPPSPLLLCPGMFPSAATTSSSSPGSGIWGP